MKPFIGWVVCGVVCFGHPALLEAGWIVESGIVDGTVDAGIYNSIAVDETGTVHIAYYDSDNQDLKYVTQDESGNWSNQVVESSGDVGSYCSIAVDSNGVPQISYHYMYQQTIPYFGTVDRGDLKVAAQTGGSWSLATVDNAAGQTGRYTSLALDSSGRARVAYHDAAQNNLRYVENNGSWGTPQTVDSGGKGASLVLDSNGYPHISHVNGTELRYVHWNGSTWVSEMVEDYQVEDERTSIALDTNGYPHIVYVNVEGLRYVYWNGTQWNDELVYWIDNGAVGISSPSLALNSNDEAFISFHGDLWGDLAVVVAVRNGDNDWSMPAWLLDGTTPGGQTSIAVDTNDILHVSFRDQTTGELGYAKVMEDLDGDWLPDWWEMNYFYDLDEVSTGNPDGDDWDNAYEYEIGTDPTVDDSAANSWDRDGDGLGNDDEVNIYGTNPDDPDSDDDGILDGVETGYHLFWDSFEEAAIGDRWSPSGDQAWMIDSSTAQHESQSVRSGAISDGESSTLELEAVLLGAGTASFWYRTSCEADSDYLTFFTNGVAHSNYSGSNDWTLTYLESIPAGTNTFRWTYEKDSSGSFGDDAVWIDSVYVGVIAIGTSPTNSDSDADGLLDGAEVYTYGTSPTNSDSDADGLLDGEEINAGSDPADSDSDDDGLNDGDEVHTYGTDPTLADSDLDLMPDSWEVMHSLNPTNGADAAADIEPDGLTNLGEYQAGTDPRIADIDGDGLNDGPEVLTWGSDPFEPDSDGDGLSDGVEALSYGSSPTNTDSDADGLFDGVETNGVGVLAFSFEDGAIPSGWSTSGDAPWYVDASNGSHRVRAARSGAISDNEFSSLQYPVTTAAGNVSYRYRISSWSPDRLVASGGLETGGGSPGDTGWLTNTFAVTAGARTLSWSYVKDIDHAWGEDCAWIDYVTVPVPGSGTDRLNPDSDGDGLKDGVETRTGVYSNALDTGTDPTDDDSDNDGLKDGVETVTGVYSNTADTGTDPTKADTDTDGLKDGWETMTGTYLSSTNTGTDPTKLDSDGDGIYDGYETVTGTYVSPTNTGTDPTKIDSDGDGLRDDYETMTGIYVGPTDTGTDPTKADTDSDGLSDNVETDTGTWVSSTNTGTDPNSDDTDGDGVVDGAETHTGVYSNASDRGTDPHDTDSDDDNLLDGVESGSGKFVGPADTGTDPNKTDTDGDGFRDDYETGTGIYVSPTNTGTDPTKRDSDGDGLNDEVETLTGIYVSTSDTGTDPNNPDTDGDGAPDGAETDTGIWVNSLDRGTDPHNPDTDGDSLWDGAETHTGIFSNSLDAGSNPLDPDSDGDGLSDGKEVVGVTIFVDSFESGSFTSNYSTAGMAPYPGWAIVTPEASNGIYSAKSPNVSSGYSSYLVLNMTEPCTRISFAYKVYSSGGHLWFKTTGIAQSFIGITEWQEASYSFTNGASSFRWEVLNAGGPNCFAWIDEIDVTGMPTGTDPNKADTDDDGLTDGAEIDEYNTDPLNPDTDEDGLNDGDEIHRFFSFSESFETNAVPPGWTTGGDANWITETNEVQGGVRSTRSGEIGENGESWIELSIRTWTNSLTFWGRAQGYTSDSLRFSVDGNTKITIPGRTDWTQSSYSISSGDHILRWTFDQNNSDYYKGNYGLIDLVELTHWDNTDPLDSDSDDDGISDGDEVHVHFTEPNIADTDSDGMPDGYEVDSQLNPLVDDTAGDADEDGLNNGDEHSHGSDPQVKDSDDDGIEDGPEVHTYGSDPMNTDSDADGLEDGDEVTLGTGLMDADSDDDRVQDGAEVHTYGTEPLVADTDADGLSDGDEVVSMVYSNSFEAAWFGRQWSTTGDAPWEVKTTVSHDGVRLAHSTFLQPQKTNTLSVTLNVLDGEIAFWWSAGMAPAGAEVEFAIDGQWKALWGGNFGWTRMAYPVSAGIHTFSWNVRNYADPEIGWAAIDSVTVPIVASGTLPLDDDSDDDGLKDGEEVNLYGSDPYDTDTDDDGLTDFAETQTYFTDPNRPDSDRDGMPDGWEVQYELQPRVPDGSGDLDSDQLSNLLEYQYGTNPQVKDSDGDGLEDGPEVNPYGSNPTLPDSDGDGLTDGDEVLLYGSDPTLTDSDIDGISDYDEIAVYGTDPNAEDSDGDGFKDGEELSAGSNPASEFSYSALAWSNQLVDASSEVGWISDVAVGSSLQPWIAYHDTLNTNVKVAVRNGTGWTTQVLDSDRALYPSIIMDTADHVHISYRHEKEGPFSMLYDLRYAHWDGSEWTTETISTNGAFWSDIAVDSNNYPHVAFIDVAHSNVVHAWWNGSVWSEQAVDTLDKVFPRPPVPSIVIGSSGDIHVLYSPMNGTFPNLKHAVWNGSTWTRQTVPGSVSLGQFSLAVDDSGFPHAVWNEWADETLRYAFWTGSAWSNEVIDAVGRVGRSPSLTLDESGRPCVAHRAWYSTIDHQNIALKYAFRDNGRWYQRVAAEEPVITMNEQGNCSLAIRAGVWFASYNDSQNDRLRFAEGRPDPDDDGLCTRDEISIHLTGSEQQDSDGDSLEDGEEVLEYGTDPTSTDTDGDFISDGDEARLVTTHHESFTNGWPTGWNTGGPILWTMGSGGYGDSGRIMSDLGSASYYSTAYLEWETESPAGEISFYLGTETHGGEEGLSFYINGSKQDAWSGRVPWKPVNFAIEAGTNTFRWEHYRSGESHLISRDNKVWIDDVVIQTPVIGTDPALYDSDGDGLGDGEEYLPELPAGSESFEPASGGAGGHGVSLTLLSDGPNVPVGWTSGGDVSWSLVSDEAYDGTGSLRSGAILDAQISWVEITTNVNAGRISFWVQTSTESAADILVFRVDGAVSNAWSGDTAWTNESAVYADGTHTFRWEYTKNHTNSAGSDAAWLDLVEFYETGIGTDPLDADTDGDNMVDGWEVDAGLDPRAGTDGTEDKDLDGSSNEKEYIADTDPNDPADYFVISFISSDPPSVNFDSSSNRMYTLLESTNLIQGLWTNVPGTPARMGVGGADVLSATNRTPSGYYQLSVEIPP